MTITHQFLTSTDEYLLANRADMVAITYTTGNIDGTESHAVRQTEWISGNISGMQPLCNSRRSVRPVSLGYAEQVTCVKCMRYARER